MLITKKTNNTFGWTGVILILIAYIALNFGYFNPSDLIYLSFNLFGSLLILFTSLRKRDYQPAVLNIIWAGVALISIFNIFT